MNIWEERGVPTKRRTWEQRADLGTFKKGTGCSLDVSSPSPWTHICLQQQASSKLSVRGEVLYTWSPSSHAIALKGLSAIVTTILHAAVVSAGLTCSSYKTVSSRALWRGCVCGNTWSLLDIPEDLCVGGGYFTRCPGGYLVYMSNIH